MSPTERATWEAIYRVLLSAVVLGRLGHDDLWMAGWSTGGEARIIL